MNSTGVQSRRAAVDMLSGLIEQARTQAVTSRSYVILAIAEPGDLPTVDDQCRIGLFRVDQGLEDPVTPVRATLLSRWQTLNTGIAITGGEINGVPNPLDAPQLTFSYGGAKNLSIQAHILAFNPRGGLHSPTGSTPVVLRIAEGRYVNGKAIAFPRGTSKTATENLLKIGRVTARPYQID